MVWPLWEAAGASIDLGLSDDSFEVLLLSSFPGYEFSVFFCLIYFWLLTFEFDDYYLQQLSVVNSGSEC